MRFNSSRGVASIIGGVFLILIILSAYAFFVMSNQATNDLQSTIRTMNAVDDDKKQETVVINNVVLSGDTLSLNLYNQGPKDVDINYIGWMNEDKPNAVYTFTKVDLVISPDKFLITNLDVENSTGKYQIKVISSLGNVFVASYPFVSQASTSISLIQTNGPQGITVTLSGSGFTSNSPITIEYDQQPITPSNLTLSSNGSGLFSTTFTVPPSPPGAHSVKATDGNLFFASATYTRTQATLNIYPNSGNNTDVHITGSGYIPNSNVSLKIDAIDLVGPVQADQYGVIATTGHVSCKCPANTAETVTATDSGENTASVTFTIK
jgi:hypothetical protein